HAHANPLAGPVRQLGDLATAVIQVGDAITVDALLIFVVVARLTALHRVLIRRLSLPVTAHALLVADGASNNGAGNRGLVAVVTMTDVVPDDCADGGPEQRAAGDLRTGRAGRVAPG